MRAGASSLSAYLAAQNGRRAAKPELAVSANRLAQLKTTPNPLPSPGRRNCFDKRLSGSSGVRAVIGYRHRGNPTNSATCHFH